MKLSWNSLRISFAGARISHLVQKDKIWDHGTMIEQVKVVFVQLQKVIRYNDPGLIKKYTSVVGFHQIMELVDRLQNEIDDKPIYELNEVNIIAATKGKNSRPDCFKALIKGRKTTAGLYSVAQGKQSGFKTEWTFIRQGNWWVLDSIKSIKKFSMHLS